MGKQDEQNSITTGEQPEQVAPDLIYYNNILSYTDDFISQEYPDKTPEELKQDKSFFPALINYVYNHYLGHLFKNKLDYKLQGIRPKYDDIQMIDRIFDIYISLVYKYKFNNRPSINEFTILTGISHDTIYKWLNGDIDSYILKATNDDGRKYITSEYAETVKKWQAISQQALTDGNGVMEIFLLKSVHGFRDQNNEITVNHVVKPVVDADNLPSLLGINSKD